MLKNSIFSKSKNFENYLFFDQFLKTLSKIFYSLKKYSYPYKA